MYESGKAHNIVQQMQRMKGDILDLNETRGSGRERSQIKDQLMYYPEMFLGMYQNV